MGVFSSDRTSRILPCYSCFNRKRSVKQIVFFIVVGFTLPLRSICWTLWYTNLAGEVDSIQPKPKKKSKKGSVKKVSGKTFKIEKRGIDPEIIRRARLEDDEY